MLKISWGVYRSVTCWTLLAHLELQLNRLILLLCVAFRWRRPCIRKNNGHQPAEKSRFHASQSWLRTSRVFITISSRDTQVCAAKHYRPRMLDASQESVMPHGELLTVIVAVAVTQDGLQYTTDCVSGGRAAQLEGGRDPRCSACGCLISEEA